MEDILDEMLATDPKSVNDFGCDNMTAILIKFKWFFKNSFINNFIYLLF